MGREVIRRALATGAVLATLAVPGVLAAGPASAASAGAAGPTGSIVQRRAEGLDRPTGRRVAPPVPTAVTISGEGLDEPITVRAADNAALCEALGKQVSWLHTEPPQSAEPTPDKRGPGYRMVLLVKDRAVGTYDLYPRADGGPRIYRPAAQPDRRKTDAGWFYGRLNMSEALRTAGAPLPEVPDVVSGGIGGGERVNGQETLDTREDVDRLFAQLRQVLLLNAGVLLIITAGLAGMSLLIRRRI